MTHKVEAAGFSTIVVNFYQITQCHISENCIYAITTMRMLDLTTFSEFVQSSI